MSRDCRVQCAVDSPNLWPAQSGEREITPLGFEDPSYFSRFFRRETGQTPKEFRNALRR